MGIGNINKTAAALVALLIFLVIGAAVAGIWHVIRQQAVLETLLETASGPRAPAGGRDGAPDAETLVRRLQSYAVLHMAGLGLAALSALLIILALLLLVRRRMTAPVRRAVERLAEAAGKVTSASFQVSSVSQGTAKETSHQAATLEEAITLLKEMAALTRENAAHASQANDFMQAGKTAVQDAEAVINELTASMEAMHSASEQMDRIIKSIDEVAFQTKILALNAAVEAARAGEAGAAFGVVAGEVKNLAVRAAEAAGDTSQLIQGTILNLQNGAALVGQVNETFQKVASSVTGGGGLVREIAQASREQSQGVQQTYDAVSKMYKATHQSAINAELSASASVEMLSQAERLSRLVEELVARVGGDKRIDKLVRGLAVKELNPGDFLIRQGETGTEAYIIDTGEFNIFVDDNPRKILSTVKAGDIVGEVALVMDVKRTANVVAATPARVIVLRKEEFLKVFKNQKQLSQSVLGMVKRRMGPS